MKNLFILLSFLFTVNQAFATQLETATNDQILQELDRRLNGGINPNQSAQANYICDSSATLSIFLAGSSGSDTKTLYIGNTSSCTAQAQQLNLAKSKIFNTTIAAACDSSATLYRYVLKPSGTFGDTNSTYVGNMNSCLDQAKSINSLL